MMVLCEECGINEADPDRYATNEAVRCIGCFNRYLDSWYFVRQCTSSRPKGQ